MMTEQERRYRVRLVWTAYRSPKARTFIVTAASESAAALAAIRKSGQWTAAPTEVTAL